MAYFTIDNVTDKSFNFTLADLDYPFTSEHYLSVVLKVDGEIMAQITPVGMTEIYAYSFTIPYDISNSETFESGKTYEFSVTVYTKDGNAWNITTPNGNLYASIYIPYPDEVRPDKGVYNYCYVERIGNKSLRVYVDFGAIYTAGYMLDDVYVDSGSYVYTLTGNNPEVYLDYLTDGMTYTFTFYAYYKGLLPTEDGEDVTKTINRTITLFGWTDDELYALENRGEIKTITRERWNELCDYALTTLGYWGIGGDAIGANNYGVNSEASLTSAIRGYTKMTSQDKKLYAAKFNILNYCISQEISTVITDQVGITDVESGIEDRADKVLGEYFITLVDCLNYK